MPSIEIMSIEAETDLVERHHLVIAKVMLPRPVDGDRQRIIVTTLPYMGYPELPTLFDQWEAVLDAAGKLLKENPDG